MHTFRGLSRGGRIMVGLVVAGAAFAVASSVYASIPDSSGVIHACYKTVGGGLRVIDTGSDGACNASESALNWNATGPTGATGARGSTGATGATGSPGPTNVYSAEYNGADFPVPGNLGANNWSTLIQLTVPAGSYVVNAKSLIDNNAQSGDVFVACRLQSPSGAALDSTSFDLPPFFHAGYSISFPLEATYSGAGGTFLLQCELPFPGSIFAGLPRIIATKVDTITKTS